MCLRLFYKIDEDEDFPPASGACVEATSLDLPALKWISRAWGLRSETQLLLRVWWADSPFPLEVLVGKAGSGPLRRSWRVWADLLRGGTSPGATWLLCLTLCR